jgi:hypothetical protein
MAGYGPKDFQFAEFYDCYTILHATTLEDAGICPKGEIGAFFESTDTTFKGSFPINTDGGQLSCGQFIAGSKRHAARHRSGAPDPRHGRRASGRAARPLRRQRQRRLPLRRKRRWSWAVRTRSNADPNEVETLWQREPTGTPPSAASDGVRQPPPKPLPRPELKSLTCALLGSGEAS